ncbi:MAG: DEAD/DEAH box helicase [Planctomycetes bacterium]|nr:DEAD/DEAH box helicase [Planctomycetota bacterium]
MIAFRCRDHRAEHIQLLLQVAPTDEGSLAARPLVGSHTGEQKPGGWLEEKRPLAPGLYCQRCLAGGGTVPLPDYDEADLRDAGLLERPHVGLKAKDFDVDIVWTGIKPRVAPAVVAESERAERDARYDARLRQKGWIEEPVASALSRAVGGGELYSHQAAAIDAANRGADVVIETATASGKSLCYWGPVLNRVVREPAATALYLAPLNALAEDQLNGLDRLGETPTEHYRSGTLAEYTRPLRLGTRTIRAARYEGSIKDPDVRKSIRLGSPNIVITNPDMLHHGLLPHHEKLWRPLFSNLAFIVLDELHTYKGMFGANVANIVRRVLRIAGHYGKHPQIIGCSASIGNPVELFTAITGRSEPVLIAASDSGAPVRRQKRVILDVTAVEEAMPTLAKNIVVAAVGEYKARTITFMHSIPEVDQVYRYVSGELGRALKGVGKRVVREYKREIPPAEKARVTSDLRTGATLGVISTTALQLGIDIGDLSVCVVCKFPGSKAAFQQQAGRVGRNGESLVLFVADESPLDQHYVARPDELLHGSPEVVYLNPDHRETVLNHLRCAAEELPLDPSTDCEFWGPAISDLVSELKSMPGMAPDGREVLVVRRRGEAASEVNIRSLGFECVVRDQQDEEVARPDVLRAMRRFHKYARFQIQEQSYEVARLSINWGNRKAEAIARQIDKLDYTTASVITTDCAALDTLATRDLGGGRRVERGNVRFTVHVDGYYKVPAGSGKPEYQPLGVAAPPQHELDTEGLWFSITDAALTELPADDVAPSLTSALEALRVSAALLCSTDPDDIGVHLGERDAAGAWRLYLADNAAGGNGLTEQVYGKLAELTDGALRILRDCPQCSGNPESRGCARCVTTQWGDDSDVCRAGGMQILGTLSASLSGRPA